MTLNCLGAICSKVCESCSFNICNSNRSVLLVGSTDNKELNTMISGNQGLLNIVTQLGGQLGNQLEMGITLIPTRNILQLEGEDNNQIRDAAVRAAIIKTSLRETSKLVQVNESFENGWKKFLLAQVECNMNLDTMCKDAEPLSEAAVKKLDKAVNKVAKYYLSAIHLWKIFCENGADPVNILRYGQISKAQVGFIIKQMQGKLKLKKLSRVDNFWKLDVNIQKIFLDGAVKYFKKHMHDYCRALRTAAFQVTVVEGQKSNENFLHDQVVKVRLPNPPLGEHKAEEVPQIEVDAAFLDVSSKAKGSTGTSREPSPQRLQAQMQEAPVAMRRSSQAAGTPDVSLRGNTQEESSHLLTKAPPSPLALTPQ